MLQFMLHKTGTFFNYGVRKLLLMKIYLFKKIGNTSQVLKLIERKLQNMLKEIFTSVSKYSILHKERKK